MTKIMRSYRLPKHAIDTLQTKADEASITMTEALVQAIKQYDPDQYTLTEMNATVLIDGEWKTKRVRNIGYNRTMLVDGEWHEVLTGTVLMPKGVTVYSFRGTGHDHIPLKWVVERDVTEALDALNEAGAVPS